MRYYQIKELLDLKPDSQSVTLKGWVKTFRSNRFISLNDGSSQQSIQCVVDFENTEPKILQKINSGASLEIKGLLKLLVDISGIDCANQHAEINQINLHLLFL